MTGVHNAHAHKRHVGDVVAAVERFGDAVHVLLDVAHAFHLVIRYL